MTASDKKILYLSYDGLTDPLGQSQILPYLIGLSSKGFRFVIVTFEKEWRFRETRMEIETICLQNDIVWLPKRYHKRPPVLSTIFDLLILWRAVGTIIKNKDISIVHCRSYLTSIVGLAVKRRWNVKFVFDMRGFWADERVEGGLWKLSNPIYKLAYKFFKKEEIKFLQEADHVVSLTFSAKEEIESWKINSAPIMVIPTCVDLDLFDPAKIDKSKQDALRIELGIGLKDYVLLYLGSWGTWYLIDEMLDFFLKLKRTKPTAKFLIVTNDKVNLRGLPFQNDILITHAARTQVPLHISIASASICLIKPSFSKKASSATKMGEIMAMNVPIVMNKGWGDAEAIIKSSCGVLYESEQTDVETIVKDNAIIKTREYCQNNLSVESGTISYSYIYGDLVKNNS